MLYQIECENKQSVPIELCLLSFFSLVFKSAWANIYYGAVFKNDYSMRYSELMQCLL